MAVDGRRPPGTVDGADRSLEHRLRQDAEALVFWTKVVNIALMPILVALAGLAIALIRRRRSAA